MKEQSTIVPAESVHALNAAVIDRLFLLVRTVGTHGNQHPTTHESAYALIEALQAATPPLALQFVREATFRDKDLIPQSIEAFQRAEAVSRALSNCGAHELVFDAIPDLAGLMALGDALARGQQGVTDRLESLQLDNIRWREIPGAGWGAEAKQIDPDLFAVTQISLAVAEADVLLGDANSEWNWSRGVAVVRRLERAFEVHPGAAMRAIEFAPPPWSVGRRAAAASLYTTAALAELATTQPTARAAAHTALALACAGLQKGPALALPQAAAVALGRLLAAPMDTPGGAARHRLRVCSLVHAIEKRIPFRGHWTGLYGLLDLTYALEDLRQPTSGGSALTMADLLAQVLGQQANRFPGGWLRVLVASLGELPAGSRVRLADGRVGIVLGPGNTGQAWQPEVLVGAAVVQPDRDVTLVACVPGRGTAA